MCCRWRTPWGSAPGRRSSRCTNQRLPRQTAPSPSRLTGRCTCAKRAALRVERRRLAERRPGRSLPHITKLLHSPFVPVGIRRGHAMSRAKTAALHAAAGERRTPSPPQGASVAQSPACLPRTRRGKWTHRRRTRQALAAGEVAAGTADGGQSRGGNFLQLACQYRDMLAFPALALAANQDGDLHAETRHLTLVRENTLLWS